MRILVLTKRQYTNKDLLDDRFGRMRELPLSLARRGHDVRGICLSYENRDETEITDSGCEKVNVRWKSINAGKLKLIGLIIFTRQIQKLVQEFQPHIVWSSSDSFYGIIGNWVAKNKSCSIFDLYDNYESFFSTSIPGIRPLYKRSVRGADGVTCVSNALDSLVKCSYGRSKPTLVLPNGIRRDLFFPCDKNRCRKYFGLPLNARIIGMAGGISENRGISTIFEGFMHLSRQHEDLHLAFSGARSGDLNIPKMKNAHDLGILPLDRVSILLGALDVAIISNKYSAFGRYCFPQKFYEIVACRVPLVASAVGSMEEILENNRDLLFEPENPTDFVRAVDAQLEAKYVLEHEAPTWDDLVVKFERFLLDISNQRV